MTTNISHRAISRGACYRRIFSNYALRRRSHLSLWHERPEVNPQATFDRLDPFYMTFRDKANYPGPFDEHGTPMLNYGGSGGLQYNPIAIAQYGLANYNLIERYMNGHRRSKFLRQADWLANNLEYNVTVICFF